MVLIQLRHALPSRILLETIIDGYILLKEGEPIVALCKRTSDNNRLAPS